MTLLKKYIFSREFLDACRVSPKYFTRQRSLPFATLILFLLNFLKGSLQDELDWFFKHVRNADIPLRVVSKSALCQARKKLSADAFRLLNSKLIQVIYQYQLNLKTWRGYRLIAADGTSLLVPDTQEMIDRFGYSKNSVGTITPMAKALALYDPLNGYLLDAEIGHYKSDERKQLLGLLDRLGPNDLLLLDRGFPAFWLFRAIAARRVDFLCRLPIGKWAIAQKLVASGERERFVVLQADHKNKKTLDSLNLPTDSLTLRVIQIDLPDGRPEVLITTLTDTDKYPHEDVSRLYFERWRIEEDFKLLKSRAKLEHYTGVTPLTVYQDFHAKSFSKNIAALLRSSVDQTLDKQEEKRKHRRQVNRTQTLSKLKDVVVTLFLSSRPRLERVIQDISQLFARTTESIRPNRSFPRKRKKRSGFATQYKPTR